MFEALKIINLVGFVPVVALEDEKKAVGLAQALEKGGIPIVEVTYRTVQASECIREIRKNCPNVVVGAGTVLSVEQVKSAIDCGAAFIVSPGYDEEITKYCVKNNVPIIPGVSTAGEIQKAIRHGLEVLKFFPAEPSGGLQAINFLAAPFKGIKFLPAGGILMNNLGQYLANKNVFACAGGFVARANMIETEDWDGISELCEKAVHEILGFEFGHVGINCNSTENAMKCASFFSENFNQSKKDGNSSIFIDNKMELMKKPFRGTDGHIGFFTNSVERAIFRLEKRGCKILKNSICYDEEGFIKSAYLEEEIGGFAIHVVCK